MPRPTTKSDLLFAAKQNYEKLNLLISKMTEKELQTEFDFSEDKKKEAHWQRDKNLRDVLIHLYEWQQLLLIPIIDIKIFVSSETRYNFETGIIVFRL